MVKDGLWVLLAALLLVFQVIAQEVPAEKEKKENTGSRKVKVERELTEAELRALEGRLSKPAQAAMLSVVFPGGGQLYNRSYWKIPIFYSVLSFLGYTVRKNHDEYIEARNNHIYLTDKDPTNDRLIDRQRFPGFQAQNFIDRRDRYRRERDYYLILSILWYGVSVADAAVDAHFEGFDVSDNLSLKISPRLESIPVVVGRQPAVPSVTFALSFR